MAETDPGMPHVDIAGYVLGVLTPLERRAFEAHLADCVECQHELEELRRLPAILETAGEPVEPPSGLAQRVLAGVAEEPPRPVGRPASVTRLRPQPARRLWRPAWAAAAAAMLLVAFLAGIGVEQQLTKPPMPAPGRTVQLVAAAGFSGSGTAVIRSSNGGQQIELSVKGLPAPAPGHFYTCWLVADDDTLVHQDRVSVGSFTAPGTSGTQTLTLRWETAADLGRFRNLGVTLEPDNGNPLHQGPKVLQGTRPL